MEKIKTLSIDLETFSDVDLAKCGVYRYVESPAFEILLFGVSVNGGDVVVAVPLVPYPWQTGCLTSVATAGERCGVYHADRLPLCTPYSILTVEAKIRIDYFHAGGLNKLQPAFVFYL